MKKNVGASIDNIIRIIKLENKKFKVPIVTEIAKKGDPFKVLISCLLSLRTKDETTAKASLRLFQLADTPAKIITLKLPDIEKAIYPVGFYKVKAGRIKEICKRLLDNYDGNVPDEIDELLKLKGVGRKTANLVVTLGYNKLGICVDIHVHRISNRLGYVKTVSPDKTEMALRKKLPKKYWKVYNDFLVTYGQNICVPVSPKCSVCKVINYCNRIDVKTSR
ncbi:MAG: endonuclease III domain-containing protein [Candidatus Anammoxibacter sp.]